MLIPHLFMMCQWNICLPLGLRRMFFCAKEGFTAGKAAEPHRCRTTLSCFKEHQREDVASREKAALLTKSTS